MKRILIIIASIILTMSLVACGKTGSQGPKGESGATGPQGPKGESGATGLQGETGNDGLSAFEIFKKYYPEYTGTEEDWIYATATNNVCLLFGHKEVIDEAIDATCTVNGLTEGKHCEVCKKVLVNQEVTEASHDYVDNICSKCGFNSETNGIKYELSEDGESYSIVKYKGTDTELVIPSSYNGKPVTSIERNAFAYCSLLEEVWIPDSIISVGYFAFGDCISLRNVTIGKGVTSIGNTAFTGCKLLTNLIVSNENEVYDSRNNCNAIIETVNNKLIIGCNNTVIPSSVTIICDWAFLECTFMSISIPKSIVAINCGAFSDCFNLTEVYYEGSKNQWKEVEISDAWNANSWFLNATLICTGVDETEKDGNEFIYESNGDGTSSIVGVATIIIIPSGAPNGEIISSIASYSFCDLRNLIIEIPSSILEIELYAFYNCDIKEIRYSGTVEEWNNISKNDGLWNYNSSGFTVICSDGELTY